MICFECKKDFVGEILPHLENNIEKKLHDLLLKGIAHPSVRIWWKENSSPGSFNKVGYDKNYKNLEDDLKKYDPT